jgi:hypothetical protein
MRSIDAGKLSCRAGGPDAKWGMNWVPHLSGLRVGRGRQGQRVAALPAISPQTFAWALTTPPMAFNSEQGTFQKYVNAINMAQAAINCLFGNN